MYTQLTLDFYTTLEYKRHMEEFKKGKFNIPNLLRQIFNSNVNPRDVIEFELLNYINSKSYKIFKNELEENIKRDIDYHLINIFNYVFDLIEFPPMYKWKDSFNNKWLRDDNYQTVRMYKPKELEKNYLKDKNHDVFKEFKNKSNVSSLLNFYVSKVPFELRKQVS